MRKNGGGKTTFSRELAEREDAVLLVQNDFLSAPYPGEILDIPDFVRCSSRLRGALSSHICALLAKGESVVLDFPGNTKKQRTWFRTLFEHADIAHELHFIDVPDDLCKRQLKDHSKHLPVGAHGQRTPSSMRSRLALKPLPLTSTSTSVVMSAPDAAPGLQR